MEVSIFGGLKENQMPPDYMIFLYGPPGVGKTALGTALAGALERPFFDLDVLIEKSSGYSIPEIFSKEGEAGFRVHEKEVLKELLGREQGGIVALGGGTLLSGENRALAEAAGEVLCLAAPLDSLLKRLAGMPGTRPLLEPEKINDCSHSSPASHLEAMLSERGAHYASFPTQLDTGSMTLETAVQQAKIKLGRFRITSMGTGHDVLVREDGLQEIGTLLKRAGLSGPIALVSDDTVASLFGSQVLDSLGSAGFSARLVSIPPGEASKNLETACQLWNAFIEMGLERGSTVLALGGGVVGDLAGFAASVFMRGVPWAAIPTTLLSMVDASLGGKTAIDLPEGKNLIGAFYPASLVLADPLVLEHLPETEVKSGLAEVLKAGIIGDPGLFRLCASGFETLRQNWQEVLRRAMAVKIEVIQEDPYERGRRAALNLGHTIGHALETASGYQLRHGEAVGIGLVLEARLAEGMGLAEAGLADEIAQALMGIGLLVCPPAGLGWSEVLEAMEKDKKRSQGKVRFSLPLEIGKVQTGIVVEEEKICELFSSCMDPI